MTRDVTPATPYANPSPLSLGAIFGRTWAMLGRHFALVYPISLHFIVLSMMFGALFSSNKPAALNLPELALLLGVPALLTLFKAGWTYCMVQAAREDVNRLPEADEKLRPINTFAILKHFIPGIGGYGAPFLLGAVALWLIQTGTVTLAALIGVNVIGVPEKLLNAIDALSKSKPTMEVLMEKSMLLTRQMPVETQQLGNWMLLMIATGFVLVLINFLMMYWENLVILRDINGIKALWASAKLVVKKPFASFGITLMILGSYAALFILLAIPSSIISLLSNLLLVLLMVFWGLFLARFLISLGLDIAPTGESTPVA